MVEHVAAFGGGMGCSGVGWGTAPREEHAGPKSSF